MDYASFLFNLIVYRYLKTFSIMAKFDLKFLDTFDFTKSIRSIYNYQSDEEFNEHWIEISINSEGLTKTICLDKSTAIKFAKTLRTEINKITEREV